MGIRPHVDESPTRDIHPDPQPLKGRDKQTSWHNFHNFGRDDRRQSPIPCPKSPQRGGDPQRGERRDWPARRVGLAHLATATPQRQDSEKREHLVPVQRRSAERRAISASRHNSTSLSTPRSKSSPPLVNPARTSAPAATQSWQRDQPRSNLDEFPQFNDPISPIDLDGESQPDHFRPPRPSSRTSSDDYDRDRYRFPDWDERNQLNAELDSKWILNLSMHFRDRADHEKFFVTYAERPNRWRRVTVTCDYRNAEPGSLEMDLRELQFQRDKSFQIYESIRESLADIHFYETVTNLKLHTSDSRLHVHVTEDVNEIIPYPPKTTVDHILKDENFAPMEVLESELVFDSHLSGFVYKVCYQGRSYIKKEIPGPDTVDEFLYEINALHALHGSEHVIQLEAIVVDDLQQSVKGLLISYAERGAVVDLLYDQKGEISWDDRVRWAQQAVQGLSEIHAEGYVQGDFTLSNIVVDQHNNAQIIDINRRGCPVGWEPPEIARKIASNQRISMYIGEKSDIYQLGMTLWALAMDDDEPERHDSPLSTDEFPSEVPEWYQDIVRICLATEPRDRLSARDILLMFPSPPATTRPLPVSRISVSGRTERGYIDPASAVERDDIERFGRNQSYQDDTEPLSLTQSYQDDIEPLSLTQPHQDDIEPLSQIQYYQDDPAYSSKSSFGNDYTYTYPRSSNYEFESGSSQIERSRGRRPPTNLALTNEGHGEHFEDELSPLDSEDFEPQIVSVDPGLEPAYDEIELAGHLYLIPRNTLSPEDLWVLERPSAGQREEENIEHAPFSDSIIEARHESTDLTEDIELDPPIDSNSESGTSHSTPRNKQSVLENSASTVPISLALDLSGTDLAGFGGHPSLDQHSPHEPKSTFDLVSSASDKAFQGSQGDAKLPPGIPFGNGGYEEHMAFPEFHQSVHPSIGFTGSDVEIKTSTVENQDIPSSSMSLTPDKVAVVSPSQDNEASPQPPLQSEIEMALTTNEPDLNPQNSVSSILKGPELETAASNSNELEGESIDMTPTKSMATMANIASLPLASNAEHPSPEPVPTESLQSTDTMPTKSVMADSISLPLASTASDEDHSPWLVLAGSPQSIDTTPTKLATTMADSASLPLVGNASDEDPTQEHNSPEPVPAGLPQSIATTPAMVDSASLPLASNASDEDPIQEHPSPEPVPAELPQSIATTPTKPEMVDSASLPPASNASDKNLTQEHPSPEPVPAGSPQSTDTMPTKSAMVDSISLPLASTASDEDSIQEHPSHEPVPAELPQSTDTTSTESAMMVDSASNAPDEDLIQEHALLEPVPAELLQSTDTMPIESAMMVDSASNASDVDLAQEHPSPEPVPTQSTDTTPTKPATIVNSASNAPDEDLTQEHPSPEPVPAESPQSTDTMSTESAMADSISFPLVSNASDKDLTQHQPSPRPVPAESPDSQETIQHIPTPEEENI
jgi:Protein kinase domain